MYYVKKRLEISAAHRLELSYESKCTTLHGHNWIITVECRAEHLNRDGMLPCNPTAENIARWVVDTVDNAWRCEVQESEGNVAIYEKD